MAASALGLLGLLIGLLGVLAGLVATLFGVAIAVLVQWNETQRAHNAERWTQSTTKRERLRAEFERVLMGAYAFESLTSIHVWVNPRTLPPGDYKDRLTAVVDKAYEGFRLADVRLRLEGATEVVDAIHELARMFGDFQADLVDKSASRDVWEKAQKIKELVKTLDVRLQKQLDELTPPDPLPDRRGLRGWIAEIWNWIIR